MPKYLDETGLTRFYNNIADRPAYAFDTVADMQAATYLEDGMTCHTNGFHTSGDGGAAYYTVGTSGTANSMDVLALQDGLFATLVVTEPYVTPEQFGAYGDGTTDDSTALQAAIDSGKTVEMIGGKTYLGFSLEGVAKCVIHGNGATIKRPNLSVEPYNYTVSQMKSIRTISIDKDIRIDDLNFDNNCFSMWQLSDGYAQEQAAALIIGNSDNEFTAFINNCSFSNSAGDGILVTNNAHLFISNCESTECFRGGLTIVGRSDVNVDGWISNSITLPDGFDVEMASGTDEEKPLSVNLSNVIIDNDLDITAPVNSIVNLNNVIMRDFDQTTKHGFIFNATGIINVTNSVLRSGVIGNVQTRLEGSGSISISDSRLYGAANLELFSLLIADSNGDVKLRVSDCDVDCYNFMNMGIVDGYVLLSGNKIKCENSLVVPRGNVNPQPKQLKISDCTIGFASRLLTLYSTPYISFADGVNLFLNNLVLNGDTGSDIRVGGSPNIHFGSLVMSGAKVLSKSSGASPNFYGNNRIIIVETATDLTFAGWIKNNDIAIAKDTNIRYVYQSGTTWNEV